MISYFQKLIFKKKKIIYNTVNFCGAWIYGLASLMFFVLLNPIVELWLGSEYLIDNNIVFVLIINFFLMGMINTFNIFRNAFGLFVQGQIRPVISSIINLVASLILAYKIGIIGVFIGTSISFISMNAWFDPYIVHKHVLKTKVSLFYFKLIMYVIVIGFSFILTNWLCNFIIIDTLIMSIVVKFILCFVVGNSLFLIVFHRTKEFEYLLLNIKRIVKSLLDR